MSLRLAALALLLAACGSGERPRNLLIVCVDTLRADELGAYGQSPSRTPCLDRLASESAVFERAHSAASWTLPSVGATFTSAVPATTGLWTFESRLSDSFVTLAERFQAAGWATHGIASHVYFNQAYGLQQGFDTFDDELCKKGGESGWVEVTSPQVSARAVRWLHAHAGEPRPWLLFVHFFDPHVPYLEHAPRPAGTPVPDERSLYRGEIAFTDGYVGAVLDALRAAGHQDDTTVLFLSDHGESFLEHPPIKRHSYGLYEEELRVPLFLRVPGCAPRRVHEFVRTVDLLPTLLELHGIARGTGELAGKSLVASLRGEVLAPEPLLAEIRLKDGFHASVLLRAPYKLYEDVSNGRFQLFDLEVDPLERQDLAAARPELVEELRAELVARRAAATARGARHAPGGSAELDPDEAEHLRQLGYAGDE